MSLVTTIDQFGDLLGEPRAPRVEYVENYPRPVNLNALTEQERKWLAEAEQEKQS